MEAKRAAPLLLFFLSLLVIRLQIVRDLGLDLSQAWHAHMGYGLLYDFSVALFALGAAGLLGFRGGKWHRGAVLGLWAAVWLADVANATYFRFFGTGLSLWTLRLHWTDMTMVSGSAADLGKTLGTLASALLFGGAAWIAWRISAPFGRGRWRVLSGALLMVAALLLRQSPVWFNWIAFEKGQAYGESRVLGEQVVVAWVEEVAGSHRGLISEMETDHRVLKQHGRTAETTLAELRDRGGSSQGGLRRAYDADDAVARDLRRQLGLPLDGPVNVVMIFMESTRGYEFFNPRFSDHVLPGLWSQVRKRGWLFRQTYSSSGGPGQTVRGEFSTQCSAFPNMQAPAEYLVANQVSTVCLQGFLRDHGYQTLWINGFDKSFHGKEVFERLHGTQKFYDWEHFFARGMSVGNGRIGIEDEDLMPEALRILHDEAETGRPFFVNLTTITTHHPHTEDPANRVPPEIKKGLKSPHWNFLTRLNGMDRALNGFLDGLFADPLLGPRTLVVFLGDHGVTIDANMPADEVGRTEVKYRIPLAFLTAHARPREFAKPVHQVDVVPSIAAVLGFDGEVTWLGHNVLDGRPGTPWVYREEGMVSYRLPGRGCYALRDGRRHCVEVGEGKDPLLDAGLKEVAESDSERTFFEDVAASARLANMMNLYKRPR